MARGATGTLTNPLLTEVVKEVFAASMWSWFYTHQDTKILHVGFWFIKKNVYVKDVKGVFELLFGDEPMLGVQVPTI